MKLPLNIVSAGTGEMAQHLGVLAALPEYVGLVLSTCLAAHNCL